MATLKKQESVMKAWIVLCALGVACVSEAKETRSFERVGAQTAFGRAGWFAAGAQYTYFVGFRHVGTGQFFTTTYMIVLHEDVDVEAPEGQAWVRQKL